jgi:hypothetical protein
MDRRVRVPARLADASGARMKEGPLPSRNSWEKRPRNRRYKPGDWSNGRTPGVTVAAIPVRIRAPQEPE